MTQGRPVFGDISVDHTADIARITEIIAEAQRAMNSNDAELLVRRFAANGSSVGAPGKLVTGYAAMLASAKAAFGGFLGDRYARYEPIEISFLRPDVALARKHAFEATVDGVAVTDQPAMIGLYVLVKEGGEWWIATRQNTLIPE
ncbi:SgcJ/EcaC family oxidoreductase [Pseudonocardiaceae bacterium YIM PH 21723]|nr:SgcJ/EcaC family oxidoreductase [Pseudonocardiaceae bacterium YIM PH 21723]